MSMSLIEVFQPVPEDGDQNGRHGDQFQNDPRPGVYKNVIKDPERAQNDQAPETDRFSVPGPVDEGGNNGTAAGNAFRKQYLPMPAEVPYESCSLPEMTMY